MERNKERGMPRCIGPCGSMQSTAVTCRDPSQLEAQIAEGTTQAQGHLPGHVIGMVRKTVTIVLLTKTGLP